MPHFKKRPVVIEAWQHDGKTILDWLQKQIGPGMEPYQMIEEKPKSGWSIDPDTGMLMIATLEGIMYSAPGSWIIKGIEGEFYGCVESVFEKTYEAVDA